MAYIKLYGKSFKLDMCNGMSLNDFKNAHAKGIPKENIESVWIQLGGKKVTRRKKSEPKE